jgi:hypothetical protein
MRMSMMSVVVDVIMVHIPKMSIFQSLVPVNVTLHGKRNFAGMIKDLEMGKLPYLNYPI